MKKDNFTGFFTLAFLVVGFCLTVFAARGAWDSTRHNSMLNVMQGTAAHHFEKAYDKALPHYAPSVHIWDKIAFTLFGEGRKGVLIGEDGWLFSDEEFYESKNFPSTFAAHIMDIKNTHQTLTSHNVKLLVVPIPAKARLYQEKLGRYNYPAYWAGVYPAFLKALEESGVTYVDALAAFNKHKAMRDIFLRTDTHWSPDGARLTAELVAEKLSTAFPYLSFQRENFTMQPGEPQEYKGDLMRYVATGAGGIKPEYVSAYTLSGVAIEKIDEDSLFGEKDIPVVLVGTSYSANTTWGFEYALNAALQTDLFNAAQEGAGPFKAMQAYLKSDSYVKAPPQLVIWEIPERYLATSPTGEKL